jgi:hypothetical protein
VDVDKWMGYSWEELKDFCHLLFFLQTSASNQGKNKRSGRERRSEVDLRSGRGRRRRRRLGGWWWRRRTRGDSQSGRVEVG